MHLSRNRIAHTMAFVTPAMEHWLERELAQWRIDPTTHCTMSRCSTMELSLTFVEIPDVSRIYLYSSSYFCSIFRYVYTKVVRVFTHGAMGCRIDSSWGGPIEVFLIPTSAPQLV